MDVVHRMHEHGIVLSTIGIGEDIHQEVLTGMASAGGGNYTAVNAGDDLVKQMLRDASLYRSAYTVTGTQVPMTKEGTFTDVPALDGYIRVTARPTADTLLSTRDGDPLYAVWTYGKGRTAAFMSDLEGKWSQAWFRDPAGRDVIRMLLSGIMPDQAQALLQDVCSRLGGEMLDAGAALEGGRMHDVYAAVSLRPFLALLILILLLTEILLRRKRTR